jgi:hypothetical protein
MTPDPNTRRLMDRIDLLERANNVQLATIEKYRGQNVGLTRDNNAYAALVGELSIKPRGGAKIKRRRPT